MSANGGAGGGRGTSTLRDGETFPNPGSDGANSGTGTGGTVTTGGGKLGGAGTTTSTGNPGTAGNVTITWS
jgi:hypothetical protein